MADASGGSYVAYATADEAGQDPDAALIMEGDYGGQIYLACPLSAVAASEGALQSAAPRPRRDRLGRPGRSSDPATSGHRSGRASPGMGGGAVTDAIWVHEDFAALNLDDAIRQVIRGHRDRLR